MSVMLDLAVAGVMPASRKRAARTQQNSSQSIESEHGHDPVTAVNLVERGFPVKSVALAVKVHPTTVR